MPAKLIDYILEWPKAGHLGTKADEQAVHTCPKKASSVGTQAYQTAEAFGEYQTTKADGTRGDKGRSTVSTEDTPKNRDEAFVHSRRSDEETYQVQSRYSEGN